MHLGADPNKREAPINIQRSYKLDSAINGEEPPMIRNRKETPDPVKIRKRKQSLIAIFKESTTLSCSTALSGNGKNESPQQKPTDISYIPNDEFVEWYGKGSKYDAGSM
ncbi:hypothetical protein L1887_07419 [Cichorium endivia]|nr:hypothetical protein L1887_07419 [Cichorium endivia]